MTAVENRAVYDEQVIEQFRAGGRVVGGALAETPLLLLHHVGVRSRRERVTPLAWWSAGDTAVVVLASNFGAFRRPHNHRSSPA